MTVATLLIRVLVLVTMKLLAVGDYCH
jgi:hypothetical protein